MNKNPQPLVSVCCLAYNHEPFIRQCLDGFMMQQTDFPFEIIIHDDASTDGTADIIREYVAKYPDIIKPIYQKENQYSEGVNIVSTYQFPRAIGKYIALCEGDDYWTDPLKLQKQVDFLEAHEDYSICSSGYLMKKEGQIIERVMQGDETKENGFTYTLEDWIDNWLTKTLTVVFRRKALDTVDFDYKYFRDVHLFYYILKTGKGYYFSEIFGVYTKHAGGIFGGLDMKQQIIISYNVWKELWLKNKNDTFLSISHYCSIRNRLRYGIYKSNELFPLLRDVFICLLLSRFSIVYKEFINITKFIAALFGFHSSTR